MRIGELAAQSGFSVETIRFYEAKGLIDPALRTQSNYRIYGDKHLERLRFIRHCRALDMSLEDIAALVAFDANKLDDCRHVHVMVAEHVKRISDKIRELQQLREHLLALALRCPGHRDGHPCGILTGLEERVSKPVRTAPSAANPLSFPSMSFIPIFRFSDMNAGSPSERSENSYPRL